MPNGEDAYTRPVKEGNAETVLYEIQVLRFARDGLKGARTYGEAWVYLENFLLHYRNLIEFFGKPKPKDGDLSILRPGDIWPGNLPEQAVLRAMAKTDLWEKYDSWDNKESISKYLHHCTTQRAEPRPDWPVNTMYEELRPAFEQFEKMFPQYEAVTSALNRPRYVASDSDGNSTAIVSVLDSASTTASTNRLPSRDEAKQ